MKKAILLAIILSIFSVSYVQASIFDWFKGYFNESNQVDNLGGTYINPIQIATGTANQVLTTVGSNTAWADATGGGGTTTTIAGLQPSNDIFILTSTSGIAISTSSPDTIRLNLNIATTTELAITSLAGQTGCLSVNAAGKVATSTCSGGTGITSLNSQTGSTQTFSTSTDTNIQLRIVSSANDHQFTPVWAGTLADSRIASADTWNAKITTTSLSVAYPPLAYNNTTGVFTLPTSTASQSGFLSSADWTTFNNKVGTSRAINTGVGLAGGGDLSADRTLYLAAAFATSGLSGLTISSSSATWTFQIATSSATANGFLSSSDWTAFNNKVGTSRAINTGFALSGGGDLSADRTIYFSGSFATSGDANIRIASSSGTWTFSQATSTGSVSGYLSSSDWTTFNSKQNNITWPIAVASTSLTGGAGLTLTTNDMACDTASASVFGCLASADWTIFNNKQNNITWPIAVASTSLTVSSPLLLSTNDISLTGRLSTINSITTSTGALMVGKADTTGWYGLSVGSNGKVLMASSTATNGVSWETVVASASAGGANTNIQVNEAGSIAGYSTLTYSSSTDLLTVGSSTISGRLTIPTSKTQTANGQLSIQTTPNTLSFYSGSQFYLNPEECTQPFTIQYPTSTVGTYYPSNGIPFAFFPATSTINYVYGVNNATGDTATFNITYNSSVNSATTTFALFSSQQTITSTSTFTRLTPNASSTPNQFDGARISFSSASSTQFTVGICYKYNQ